MNKAEIKAELRRSACEDELPVSDIEWDSLRAAEYYAEVDLWWEPIDDVRTFFLLVAEAL